MKKIIICIFVLLLGFSLRFYNLERYPEGIHIDEASRGYNAYSILKTGKDEFGKKFPLFFQAEGEYKLPVGIYATSIFYYFFGFSKYSDRLFSVILSTSSILIIFFLFREISQKEKIAFLGMFLYSISHWYWSFARNSDNAHQIVITSTLIAVYFLILFLKKQSYFKLLMVFLFSWIGMFSYRSATLVLPLFLIGSFLIFYKKMLKLKIAYIVFIIITVCFVVFSMGTITKRFDSEGTNSTPEMMSLLGEQIREDGRNSQVFVTRYFHNKAINWLKLIGRKYWENLDPSFLFWNGDESLNNSIANEPSFLYFEIIFFIAGIYFLIKMKRQNNYVSLIAILLILSPIPSSLVFDSRNAARLLLGGFGFIFIITYGIVESINLTSRYRINKIVKLSIVSLYLFFSGYMIHEFFVHKTVHRPWYRNYSMEELVWKIEKIKGSYQKVIFEENFPILYMFISNYPPIELQTKIAIIDSYQINNKNMHLIDPSFYQGTCGFTIGESRVLYVCRGNKIPYKSKIVEVFRYRDDQISYILIEFDEAPTLKQLPTGVEYR